MADTTYYVFWDKTNKVVNVKTTEAVPSGFKMIGSFDHPSDEDVLGYSNTHTLYHHVKAILYKTGQDGEEGFWPNNITDMSRLTILRGELDEEEENGDEGGDSEPEDPKDDEEDEEEDPEP